ncbi:hypothetical protein ACVIHD_006140 [Bradyrhizobium embrapense]
MARASLVARRAAASLASSRGRCREVSPFAGCTCTPPPPCRSRSARCPCMSAIMATHRSCPRSWPARRASFRGAPSGLRHAAEERVLPGGLPSTAQARPENSPAAKLGFSPDNPDVSHLARVTASGSWPALLTISIFRTVPGGTGRQTARMSNPHSYSVSDGLGGLGGPIPYLKEEGSTEGCVHRIPCHDRMARSARQPRSAVRQRCEQGRGINFRRARISSVSLHSACTGNAKNSKAFSP